MRMVPSPTSRLTITGILTGLAATFLMSSPAHAAGPSAPGNFTGYGFDTCVAPSQTVMDSWNVRSPYSAIGIYVSGSSRYCGDAYQGNLTKDWVAHNAANGWRFMPIHVGLQSPCFKNNPDSRVQKKHMSSNTTTAREQGKTDAAETITALQKYGFPFGSVSYLDLEWYARTKTCDNAVLAFADGWTDYLHYKGYKSGVYSSGSAAIAVIDEAREAKRAGFTLPDHMWIAWTNGVANTDGGPYLSDVGWANHQRIHQYKNGVDVTYGGHKINLDKDFLDVGRGSVATTQPLPCGVKMTFSSYTTLKYGMHGEQVSAMQCLLVQRGMLPKVTGSFGAGTRAAVNEFRVTKGWPQSGLVDAKVWVSLLSVIAKPHVMKYGSANNAVWVLQRCLRAAGYTVPVNGLYQRATVDAVKAYRVKHGLTGYETTDSTVWSLIQAGKLR
jgi:peptidoglycan hydrolase-like protein with peptidoglycan-binding domain